MAGKDTFPRPSPHFTATGIVTHSKLANLWPGASLGASSRVTPDAAPVNIILENLVCCDCNAQLYSTPVLSHGLRSVTSEATTLKRSRPMAVNMTTDGNNDHLVQSEDLNHPANLIPELCKRFFYNGWCTGTGGGTSIKQDNHIFIAPSGVQKEMMKPENIFVMEFPTPKYPPEARKYLRKPLQLKPSACTPLFLAAFERGAACCIHSHSQWCVLVTLLVEKLHGKDACFEISDIEQIKGIPKGPGKGMLGFHDTMSIPIIENTPFEEDLTEHLEKAIERYPNTCAVLVRRHGIYVWGDTVAKAKTQCESLDYLFQLAVEMHKLGLPWVKDTPST